MASLFGYRIISPVVALARALCFALACAVDFIIAIWPDDRPAHTYGHPVEVAFYAPRRARVRAFEARRVHREPLRMSVGMGLRLAA